MLTYCDPYNTLGCAHNKEGAKRLWVQAGERGPIAFRFFFLPPPPPLLSLLSAPRHMSIFVHSTTHATLYAMFRASPPSIDRALLPSFMPTFSPPSSFSSLLLFSHSVLSPQQSISRAFKTGILDTTHTSLRRLALETDAKTRNKENNKGWPCLPLFSVITLSFSLFLSTSPPLS